MQCPRCAGSGTCPDCKGEGSQECPACSGSGTRETSRGQTYRCKACDGEGSMPCPPQCSSCDGSGEITEELQKKVRDTYTVRFSNFTPSGALTRTLVALNVALFLLGMASPPFYEAMLLKANVFVTHRYWEFLTPLFQHGSILHCAMNMGFLWTYGPILEGLYGRGRYLALYLGAGILGSLASWYGNCYLGGSYWGGVGASGALFGLEGAMLAVYWRWRMLSWDEVRPLTTWAAIILLGGIAAQMKGFGYLDNWAHAGGFVGGFIIAALLPRPRGH